MTTKAQEIKSDNKINKLFNFWESISDTAGWLLQMFHRTISIMVFSAFVATFAAYAVGFPGGPGALIGTLYAEICTTGGSCNLDVLNAGFVMAAVIMGGIGLVFLSLTNTDDPEGRHDELLERMDDLQDEIDEIKTRTMPAEKLIEDGADKAYLIKDDPALAARLESATAAQGD